MQYLLSKQVVLRCGYIESDELSFAKVIRPDFAIWCNLTNVQLSNND